MSQLKRRIWQELTHNPRIWGKEGRTDLEAGPEEKVDAVEVVIQAGDAALVHYELVVVVHAYHEQQRHQVVALLKHPPHISVRLP